MLLVLLPHWILWIGMILLNLVLDWIVKFPWPILLHLLVCILQLGSRTIRLRSG